MIDPSNYAANFYSDWFSWNLKRRRLSFLGAVFFGNAFVFGMMWLSTWLFGQWSIIFVVSFALLWWGAYMSIASQRLRDMQVSQWWLVGFFFYKSVTLQFRLGLFQQFFPFAYWLHGLLGRELKPKEREDVQLSKTFNTQPWD